MVKRLDNIFIVTLLVVSALCVNCVPTSVLVNSKAVTSGTNKVKRASNTSTPTETKAKANHENDDKKPPPQKRGVNSQYFDRELSNNAYANNFPNGIWEDIEPGVVYPQLQEFSEYQSPYHPKSYENLQNVLNSNVYEEPLALPIQYQYPRFLADRKKRSNSKNNLLMRLKRESKLTPADMLALVALVEAGQRSRFEDENIDGPLGFGKSSGSSYDMPSAAQEDNFEWYSPWADSAAEYYGMPYESLDIPQRFESIKENHQSPYPSKRFMVAKKKRSLGNHDWHFDQDRILNSPKVAPGFDSRIGLPEILEGGSRKYHTKYF